MRTASDAPKSSSLLVRFNLATSIVSGGLTPGYNRQAYMAVHCLQNAIPARLTWLGYVG